MALPTIKKMDFIDKIEFAAATLDKKAEIFVVPKAASLATSIYLSREV